jgi:hypothetical protein
VGQHPRWRTDAVDEMSDVYRVTRKFAGRWEQAAKDGAFSQEEMAELSAQLPVLLREVEEAKVATNVAEVMDQVVDSYRRGEPLNAYLQKRLAQLGVPNLWEYLRPSVNEPTPLFDEPLEAA